MGKCKIKYGIRDQIVREALGRSTFRSCIELARATNLSYFETKESIKRLGLNRNDIFDKSKDSERFERILKLLPEANSKMDLSTKMGMTRQRFNQIADHMRISDVLKIYFQLKRVNRHLHPIGRQSFEDILASSETFDEFVSKVNSYRSGVLRAFARMFGDEWNMIKDMLFECLGERHSKTGKIFNKDIQYWLNKNK